MSGLQSVAALIKSKALSCDEHVSRLSFRVMLNGEQHYRLGGHYHRIDPGTYLVINQGQTYQTAFEADYDLEMMLVAFNPGFAEDLLHSLVTPEDLLLDDPHKPHTLPITFFEKAFPADLLMQHTFQLLRHHINEGDAALLDLDTLYARLMENVLQQHRDLYRTIEGLGPVKPSTRIELYKRLTIAKEYMDAHLDQKLSLDQIAREACLSKYHFMRLFKQTFGQSPHQYLISQRLERAKTLLRFTGKNTREISQELGFEDASSFGKLFKKVTGTTPLQYRAQVAV